MNVAGMHDEPLVCIVQVEVEEPDQRFRGSSSPPSKDTPPLADGYSFGPRPRGAPQTEWMKMTPVPMSLVK